MLLLSHHGLLHMLLRRRHHRLRLWWNTVQRTRIRHVHTPTPEHGGDAAIDPRKLIRNEAGRECYPDIPRVANLISKARRETDISVKTVGA
ncbi:hypothetical protein [Nocardia macrotermitis]|uniref:hypothetical protein n=1 Tax=Nocardia macrotermitis TaxID=2585198 RepID=UPI001885AD40|nr:hypothetical protein [Nocardia macrotermitis]